MSGASDLTSTQTEYFEFLQHSQYWPLARLLSYQRAQLQNLLLHARQQVPYYERRLDVAMRLDGSIDWSRWLDIPIITRADLIENFDQMQARSTPRAHGRSWVMESSGSTGQPVKVTYNELFAHTNIAFNWRAESWQDCDWSLAMATRTQEFDLDGHDVADLGPWGPPSNPATRLGRHIDLGKYTSPEATLRALEKLRPAYLTTGPNTIHMFAMEARRLGIELQFKATFSHGEAVSEASRAAAREVFGAPLYERYSSREAGRMAHECTRHGGLHVNMEKVLVEIIDDDGRPCPPGVEGRVIVTPFYNTRHPLIRYEQGDLAVWGPPCPCGRTLPVIENVTGRTSAIFRHPDGRTTHRYYPTPAREALRCGIWQVAQVGPLDFEVRYVPNDWDVPADEETAAKIFRETYFSDARVSFRRTPTLRATPADKYLEYVYEVKD